MPTFAEIRLSVCLNQNVTLPKFWFSVLPKLVFSVTKLGSKSIPVAELSKARVYGRSLAGIAGLNPAGGMNVCLL